MSDQQEQNQIEPDVAASSVADAPVSEGAAKKPATAPASDVAPASPADVAAAAVPSEKPAAKTPEAATDAAVVETAAKPKRTRRSTKKVDDAEGEQAAAAKPRARRTSRTKRVVETDDAPVSDEVAQARALAQISQAQVVRAQRQAAEREAAALNELAARAEHAAADKSTVDEIEDEVKAEPERPSRTRKRVAKASQKVDGDAAAPEPAAPEQGSEAPLVDPTLRPHRRGRKPKAYVEAEKAAAAALAAQQASQAESATSDDSALMTAGETADASADSPHEDVRPGRSRRSASKRSGQKDAEQAADGGAKESSSTTEAIEQTEKPKRSRRKAKKGEQADGVDASSAESAESAQTKDDKRDKGEKPEKSDEAKDGRQNRRQHKRDRNDDRGDHKDDRNDRRQRQRDRKQRNKDRYNTPTEPTLSREELSAMKVAELREKAKEFEIETTGKKKAELVEEIYTTAAKLEGFRDITGILEIANEGYGHIHAHGYMPSRDDAFVPANLIRAARLRSGDVIEGTLRPSRANDKFPGLSKIKTVNGRDPEEIRRRPKFSDLTPIYPNEPLRMEHGKDSITGRAIDIVSPIGKGQRGLIVSPPKAGKTTILKKICQSISVNNPEVHLICLLVDERPEEVTDMQRSIKGEVVASTFDMPADNHTRVSELVIERAKRIVELGGDVVVVLDSITRLARAYNLAAPASGRILSGGVDSAALYPPKRFLGAARNIENGGSLTILASALVDTGSKMDEVIFEEFKGTGNMELKLDRDLADRRIFPAIDPIASGTRNEDLLVDEQMRPFVFGLRRILAGMNNTERAAASFIKGLKGTDTNQEFLVRTAKKANEHESQY